MVVFYTSSLFFIFYAICIEFITTIKVQKHIGRETIWTSNATVRLIYIHILNQHKIYVYTSWPVSKSNSDHSS